MQNIIRRASLVLTAVLLAPLAARADEANLILPDLGSVQFLGMSGKSLLYGGLVICALGLVFGWSIYQQLRKLPVHQSMLEVSELIYETCKTYLVTQGKFIAILWAFIGVIMVVYFGVLRQLRVRPRWSLILVFSLVGIAGSYGVAWFGIRVNTFANCRTAFAALKGKPFPTYAIPLKAGMTHRHDAHQHRALRSCSASSSSSRATRRALLHRLRHRRVAGRLGAAHRRRHLHQDRRHRLGPR